MIIREINLLKFIIMCNLMEQTCVPDYETFYLYLVLLTQSSSEKIV